MSEMSSVGSVKNKYIWIALKELFRTMSLMNANLVDPHGEIRLWWDQERGHSEGILPWTKTSFQLIFSAERTGCNGDQRNEEMPTESLAHSQIIRIMRFS